MVSLQISTSFEKTGEHLSYHKTKDFDPMIKTVFWNSLGFFFFIFLLSYTTAQLFNGTGIQIGYVYSSQILGALIGTPIVGWLTDKHNSSKKNLVITGSIGRSISLIIIYLGICFYSLRVFIVGTLIQGLTVRFFYTPLHAMIAEKTDLSYRTKGYSDKSFMIGKGSLIGSIFSFLIFWIFTRFFFNSNWLIFSPLIFFSGANIYAAYLFFKNVDNKKLKKKSDSKIRSILPGGSNITIGVILLAIVFFIGSVNRTIGNPFLQAYVFENISDNSSLVMLIYIPSQVLALVFAPKITLYFEKLNKNLAIILVCSIGAISTLILINIKSGILFSIVLLFDSVVAISGQLILFNIMSKITKNNRGKLFSLISFVCLIGNIFGPIIGGIFWDDFGHKIPFLISIYIEFFLIFPYLFALFFLKINKINTKKKTK